MGNKLQAIAATVLRSKKIACGVEPKNSKSSVRYERWSPTSTTRHFFIRTGAAPTQAGQSHMHWMHKTSYRPRDGRTGAFEGQAVTNGKYCESNKRANTSAFTSKSRERHHPPLSQLGAFYLDESVPGALAQRKPMKPDA